MPRQPPAPPAASGPPSYTLVDALRAELRRARIDAGLLASRDVARVLNLPGASPHTPFYNFERGQVGAGARMNHVEQIVWQYAKACSNRGENGELTAATIWHRAVLRWEAELESMDATAKAARRVDQARGNGPESQAGKKSSRIPSARRRK